MSVTYLWIAAQVPDSEAAGLQADIFSATSPADFASNAARSRTPPPLASEDFWTYCALFSNPSTQPLGTSFATSSGRYSGLLTPTNGHIEILSRTPPAAVYSLIIGPAAAQKMPWQLGAAFFSKHQVAPAIAAVDDAMSQVDLRVARERRDAIQRHGVAVPDLDAFLQAPLASLRAAQKSGRGCVWLGFTAP